MTRLWWLGKNKAPKRFRERGENLSEATGIVYWARVGVEVTGPDWQFTVSSHSLTGQNANLCEDPDLQDHYPGGGT